MIKPRIVYRQYPKLGRGYWSVKPRPDGVAWRHLTAAEKAANRCAFDMVNAMNREEDRRAEIHRSERVAR